MKAEYVYNQSRIGLSIIVENNSNDTIAILKPSDDQFINFVDFNSSKYLFYGQNKAAYRLNIESEGNCKDETELILPPPPPYEYRDFKEYEVIVIPPQSKSQRLDVFLKSTEFVFCEEKKYFCELDYQLEYTSLTKKDLVKLNELREQEKKLTYDIQQFLNDHNMQYRKVSEDSKGLEKLIKQIKLSERFIYTKLTSNRFQMTNR